MTDDSDVTATESICHMTVVEPTYSTVAAVKGADSSLPLVSFSLLCGHTWLELTIMLQLTVMLDHSILLQLVAVYCHARPQNTVTLG